MNVVPRVFSSRYLAPRLFQRIAFVNSQRLFSSESDGGDKVKKKTNISSLLTSLKQTNAQVNFKLDDVLQRKKPMQQESLENASLEYTDAQAKVTAADKGERISRPIHHLPKKSKPTTETMARIYKASKDPKQVVSPEMNDKLKSILSKLKVDSAKSNLSRDIVGAAKSWGRNGPRYRKDIEDDFRMQSQPEPTRVTEVASLTSGGRFELFDGIFQNKHPGIEPVPQLKLLEGEDIELLEKHKSLDQRNDFLTLIEIADRQWKFPVDNEVCKVEEENVSFEEHVFLGYLLDGFPKKGPVRRFMELVINGLEQNPFMTVEQKRNQVSWFKEYFESVPEEDLSF